MEPGRWLGGGLSEGRGMRRSLEKDGGGQVDEDLEVLVRSRFCFLV